MDASAEDTDPHGQQVHTEERWTKRGASPYACLLMWLTRAHPWARRVRLDLIILFNLALALLCQALAHIVAPAIVVRTEDFNPELASSVSLAIAAPTVLGFSAWWAFSVSESTRLRMTAPHGDQPPLLLTSLVFLSFVFWMIAGAASPHMNLLRDPISGRPIEDVVQERLTDKPPAREPTVVVLKDGEFVPPAGPAFVGTAAQARPSEIVCRNSIRSHFETERHAFLCRLVRKARPTAPSLDFVYAVDWRAWGAAERQRQMDYPDVLDVNYTRSSGGIGEAVMRFASETEPWKSRIAAMRSWERSWDVLEDPAVASAFARSSRFERFVIEDILYGGGLRNLPEDLFDHAPYAATAHPHFYTYRWHKWQWSAQRELIATATFAKALAAAEQNFLGGSQTPPVSATIWDALRERRALMWMSVRAGRSDPFMRPPRAPEQRAAWIAQWEADERDAAAHTAFLQSAHYDSWKEVFLHALVMDGKFDRQIRALKPHQALSDCWRKTLARPAMGPEMAFPHGLGENIANAAALAIMAALTLAMFFVASTQAGLGDALGAFAINVIFAFVVLMVFAGMHVYDSRIIWAVGSLAVAAPLAPIVLSLWRGVRSIRTAFFGACAIWAATFWLLIVVLDLYRYGPDSQIGWVVLPWIAYVPLLAFLPAIAFARLVQTLLAQISILPLTR